MDQKNLILLYLFLCSGLIAFPQDPEIVFKNITIDDGLSQNSVIDIAQDNLGFMWFATQEGLNRYDGNEFKIFPKSFDDITNPDNSKLGKLLIYRETLWIISKGGNLEIMDLATEKFKSVNYFGSSRIKIPPLSFIFIQKKGRVWMGTESNGIYIVNENFEVIQHFFANGPAGDKIVSDKINKIFKDKSGRFWILTKNGINVYFDEELKSYLEGVNSNAIIEDSDGDIWLGSLGKGLFRKPKDSENFHKVLKMGDGLEIPGDLTVESLFLDSKMRLWVGTYGNGLYLLEKYPKRVTQFMPNRRNPYSIGFQDILSIYSDSKGGIWIGTDGGGLSFYDESFKSFKVVTTHNVPEDIAIEQIRAITTDDDGFIWYGTSGNGFARFQPSGHTFQSYHLKPYKEGINNYDRIVALHSFGTNDLWIGTQSNGTILFDRKTDKIIKWFTTEAIQDNLLLPDDTVWCFLQENKNTVWAGSRFSGLLLIHREKGMIGQYFESRNDRENVRAIARINDSLLAVGYEKKGIKLFNTKTGHFQPLIQDFIANNFNGVEIKSLYYSNDLLWAGTSGNGLLVINLKSGNVQLFTEDNELPNNMIYGILPESSQKIWASTNRGIFSLSFKNEEDEIKIEKLDLFTRKNGLQSNEFNTGASHKSKEGILFFGGISGMNYFNPIDLPSRKNDIKVIIHEATVDNISLKNEKSITYTERLELGYNQNSVALNYTGLNFLASEKLKYSYKLEGFDIDWIHAGTRKYTAYTNLAPGDYIFRVKLSDALTKEAPVTSLGISIATPYWQETWFRLLLISLFIFIIYAIYKIRLNQILEVQKVKDTISSDLHDDLGSRLTTIHLLSAISQPLFKKNQAVLKVLDKIDSEIYASTEALDEIVWNINNENESLLDMIAKIRRHVSEIMESSNISYVINTPEDLGKYKMGIQKRRELFLICKELVNNIRKHANAQKVKLQIFRENNMLLVVVQDDGIGFDPEQKTSRNGLSNLKKRVRKWNGYMEICSKLDEGTLIEIKIPFDRKKWFRG